MAKHGVRAAILGVLAMMSADVHAGEDATAGNVRAGRQYAMKMCAECHDVVSRDGGPLSKVGAPDFHAIANAKTTSAIGLNVFLVSPHPTMPNFIIADEDRRNVIAYILSLKDRKKSGPT